LRVFNALNDEIDLKKDKHNLAIGQNIFFCTQRNQM